MTLPGKKFYRWWSGESGGCHPGELDVSLPCCGLALASKLLETFTGMCVYSYGFGVKYTTPGLGACLCSSEPQLVELYFPNTEQNAIKIGSI